MLMSYVDFSRAFDSIVFNKLLAKLRHYGIDGKLLKFISAFLHDRTQCVVLENCYSTISKVVSGVPQGSVLGPVLFLVFINDITTTCGANTTFKLFADDVKLYSAFEVDGSSFSLQQSIDQLTIWANLWQLNININKCNVLLIRNKSKNNFTNAYTINGTQIAQSDSVADLGVLVNSRLSFK